MGFILGKLSDWIIFFFMKLHIPNPVAKGNFFCCRELVSSLFSSWYGNCSKDQIEHSWGWWSVHWFSFWLIPLPSTERSPFMETNPTDAFPSQAFLRSSPLGDFSASLRAGLWEIVVLSVVYRPAASASPGTCWKCRISGPFYNLLS